MAKKKTTTPLDGYIKKVEELKKKAQVLTTPNEEILKENRYFRSLLEVTRTINTHRDFDQLLELIVDSAIGLTKADRGFLMLYRKDGNLEFKVTRNIDKKTLDGEEFKISRSVVNQVLDKGEPLFLSDIYKDERIRITESIETLGLRMVMCVPLKAKERLLGLIYVDSRNIMETFSQLEEKVFEAFAAQASVAVENSYLYESSSHDSLTGLYNYGFLRHRLEEEISRALRYKKESISFIMIDLDNFKTINDAYGHLFGNTILMRVGQLIRDAARKCDIAARYGGDEFAILIPETDVQGARHLAERLQKEIGELKFPVGKDTVAVTASVGISTFPVEKIVDSDNVIVEADHALFVAKSKGRGQIAVFGLRKDEKQPELEFIGKSPAVEEIKRMISKIGKTDATVLITGETGTGKELITNLIHRASMRLEKPFIIVNCGAIPDNLLESELFGHEKGAFTGAYAQHKGKFETAQGGTIFLDEIGELPTHLQVKILRVLEQKDIDRIGGKLPIKVDVRVIAATNKNLEEEVKNGNFRKDLFYRLSVATINLPPLRERPEDIESLSRYFLGQMNQRYRRNFMGFTKDALQAMIHNPWPGNVRELIHRIERAVIMGTGQYIDENDLGLITQKLEELKTLKQMRENLEKERVLEALKRNNWNVTRTAKELGINRWSLGDLIQKYDLVRPKDEKTI